MDLSFITHSSLLFNLNNLLSPLPVLEPLDHKIKELMNINLRIFDGINNQIREKKLAILRINFLVIKFINLILKIQKNSNTFVSSQAHSSSLSFLVP